MSIELTISSDDIPLQSIKDFLEANLSEVADLKLGVFAQPLEKVY